MRTNPRRAAVARSRGYHRDRDGDRPDHVLAWALGGAAVGATAGWVAASSTFCWDLSGGGCPQPSTADKLRGAAVGAVAVTALVGGAAYAGHRGVSPWLVGGGEAAALLGLTALTVGADGGALIGDAVWGAVGAGVAHLNRP